MTAWTKADWRTRLLARRRSVPEEVRTREAAALAAGVARLSPPPVVCAYVPFGGEPGSTAMLDALVDAGAEVLLPVTGGGPLGWARYAGAAALTPGRFGIPVPAGVAREPAAIGEAGLILVPALAVDRRGVRLGRGAGYYDRSLPLADPGARLVAVVRDDEFVAALPEDAHDHRMTAALTPTALHPVAE
ncbi:MAG: 5-formyltetrahydrofolate cyclo-ligase [Mycobacteriaceae bacterium]|nr:5-formyltetrahydrofolate cyclo-ligase [Mycobacteriaceae bacterium]